MPILRELRENLNLNQSVVAQKLNITVPQLSNYETGAVVPPLEDCVILERNFGQKIAWQDNISVRQRTVIMNCLVKLSEGYPLNSVLNFATKYLREGQKIGVPEKFIQHYSKVSDELNPEPLYPPDVK